MPVLLVLLALLAQDAAPPADPPGDRTVRGVTWTPPDDPRLAAADLRAFREAGVEAARVPWGVDGALLRAADDAGVALFVDLPVAYLAAPRLLDTLAFAERALAELTALAARHPSLQGVGLAVSVDTSEPDACAYFERLAPTARAAGLMPYYVTRFVEHERCVGRAALVLVEARDRDPAALLARWRAAHDAPAGIGAFGVRVNDRVRGGHRTERSPAHQARRLEDGLRALLREGDPPPAVFVHTWQGRDYGLLDPEGGARPAYDVVRGFYTGRQLVFAIDAGPPPPAPRGAAGLVLVGWIVAALLALLLGAAPRFRQLVVRYATRHGYYREAVRRGGAEGFAAVGLVVAFALAAGGVVAALLGALAQTDAAEVAVFGMAPVQAARVLDLLGRPLLVVLVGAVLYALWLLLNMLWQRALTGPRHRLRPEQAAVLATVSRWPLLVLLLGTLLAAQADATLAWMGWIVGVWVAVEVLGAARMLYDFALVTRVPLERAMPVGLLVPLAVAALAVAAVVVLGGPDVRFLYHLATRT